MNGRFVVPHVLLAEECCVAISKKNYIWELSLVYAICLVREKEEFEDIFVMYMPA